LFSASSHQDSAVARRRARCCSPAAMGPLGTRSSRAGRARHARPLTCTLRWVKQPLDALQVGRYFNVKPALPARAGIEAAGAQLAASYRRELEGNPGVCGAARKPDPRAQWEQSSWCAIPRCPHSLAPSLPRGLQPLRQPAPSLGYRRAPAATGIKQELASAGVQKIHLLPDPDPPPPGLCRSGLRAAACGHPSG